jgi:hypothetical protein
MKIATYVAAALVLAGSMSLAQQSADGQSQSERGGNGNSPSTDPSTVSPGSTGGTGSNATEAGGTHSPLSGPSTPDHAWHGNDPLKSSGGPTPSNSDANRQMSR